MAGSPSMQVVWDNTEVLQLIGSFLANDSRGEILLLGLLSTTELPDRHYRWNLCLEWLQRRELEHRHRMIWFEARRRALEQGWMRQYRGRAPVYFVQEGMAGVRRVRPSPRREDRVEWR